MCRVLGFVALALPLLWGVALATDEKPVEVLAGISDHVPCPELTIVTYDWDFNLSDWNFTTEPCDDNPDCVPHWQYGTENMITGTDCDPPYDLWATTLNGDYPNNAGERLKSPTWTVGVGTWMVEVTHYYDIETNYDGGNVTVNGQVVYPIGGYDAVISTSTYYYACCTDLEEGYTGHDNVCFRVDCFDLAPEWVGQEVTLGFDFGSDSSVSYPGWYIKRVRVGAPTQIDIEGSTWGTVKSLYR